ncbi:MAG: nucleotidyltransferase family protein [Nakamurella sp.]
MTTPFPDAFILLTGGAGRRLGGVDKASIDVGGDTLFDRAVAAALGRPVVVVGPERLTQHSVTFTREDPPGGGPAAGIAAGVLAVGLLGVSKFDAAVNRGHVVPAPLVAILAVDHVGVVSETWQRLATAVSNGDRSAGVRTDCGTDGSQIGSSVGPVAGGALLVSGGRRQYGVGVFTLASLNAACASKPSWHGRPLREFLDPIVGGEVEARGDESRDIDTLEDLQWWLAHADAHLAQGGAVSSADDKGDLI